ncbi:unnamed protein product [Parascedosporium putredinis]|uniref:Glutamate carboxypeptidase n=1 Tax=Parascedosporium putredinis TaxID=1442378 RepID=A0A9P1MES8_9PEZI|nr:unnamed protein product [Parascedosporium putredinis]CAI8003414.1 unnamed protein product [Parascedosporium putredinis]
MQTKVPVLPRIVITTRPGADAAPSVPPQHPPAVLHHLLTSILLYVLLSFVIMLFPELVHRREGVARGAPRHLARHPDGKRAEEWSRYYTDGVHLAGKNYSQAAWTREKWADWGIKSEVVAYDVFLNYPEDHSLTLLEKKKKKEKKEKEGEDVAEYAFNSGHWEVQFSASLEEDILDEDPFTSREDRVPTFHGYSASGNVTAPFVYVNYGTYQDYEDLVQANVTLEGKIAIAKYGFIFRGLKCKRAQELGMVGCVLYSDPGDDGEVTEANGYKPYPEGPARNPSSVQRGSAQFLSVRPGDPTTPGYPSKPGVPRQPVDDSTPSIPSLPISYADAIPILRALNGHGPKASDFNKYWRRNRGLGYKGVEYNIGPTPDSVVLNLYNKQEYTTTPIWNVIGIINGTLPDEAVIVGNHRDAWMIGGASDPNSGSAVLNEVIRSFGEAVKAGWKPLRTIVFASWDGEEYGLVGSTEWVEEFLPWLSKANLAYLNVDVAVSGPNLRVSAAPLLHDAFLKVIDLVPSPNQTVARQTVADLFSGKISTMGRALPGQAIYHYHSNYDTFHWMSGSVDPGFVYHRAMAQVLGLLTAELANTPVIQFKATTYADELGKYLDKVQDALEAATPAAHQQQQQQQQSSDDENDDKEESEEVFLAARAVARSSSSVSTSTDAAEKVDAQAEWCRRQIAGGGIPWWRFWDKIKLGILFVKTNTKYKRFERQFLYEPGLDGRSWYKHVVFAPGLWTGYSGAVFPGLLESINAKDYPNAIKWAAIIDNCLQDSVKLLKK